MLEELTNYKSENNSYFISFEGIEGSGKSTQIKILKESLESKGYSVLLLREPGGSVFGEKLREAILESKSELNPLAEAHLFASSRAQLLFEKILPFLKSKNTVVLLDRYIDSSLAYQGSARGLGMETILDIHKHSPLNIFPTKTFYLKIDLETSHKRQDARGDQKDYFEKENNLFYTKLIEGYNQAAKTFPNRVITIDATHSQEQVSDFINTQIQELLGE